MDLTPQSIDTKKNEPLNNFIFNLHMSKFPEENKINKIYVINYQSDIIKSKDGNIHLKLFNNNIYDKNLANALAKNLIYLLDERFFINE